MKRIVLLILLLIIGCSKDESSNDEIQSVSAQAKLEGTWDVVRYFDTTDCETFSEQRSVDILFLDRWEIDEDGNFIHTYDEEGVVKTSNGRWIFTDKEGDVYKFQYATEFTSISDMKFNYFVFEGNKIRYLEDECILEEDRDGFYRLGTEWEKR